VNLELLPGDYAVWRLAPGSPIPVVPRAPGEVVAVTASDDEISVMGPGRLAPQKVPAEHDFRALRVRGPLDFALVGVIASLAGPLATEGVSIFVVSTFDTDYILVRTPDLERAVAALRSAGHEIDVAG